MLSTYYISDNNDSIIKKRFLNKVFSDHEAARMNPDQENHKAAKLSQELC
ncbi:3663_t:CDS:2 [Diversispora eburnea]|uniref:3663_t:CDS:1 n=1 Tax=Diversispora eburnea TaxID=1213867 RepID=A0A9N9B234_9GLOM|nr:3663_t:CDS:2 [Diversispora eburnea]